MSKPKKKPIDDEPVDSTATFLANIEKATSLEIKDRNDLAIVAELLVAVVRRRKEIWESKADAIAEAHRVHKMLTGARTRATAMYDAAEADLRGVANKALNRLYQESLEANAVVPVDPIVDGFGWQETWPATIVDKAALLAEILLDAARPEDQRTLPIGLDAVSIDGKVMQEHARVLKRAMQWPGVKVDRKLICTVGKEKKDAAAEGPAS